MGTFSVKARVSATGNPRAYRTVSLVADTGASFTTIPASVLEDLGVEIERTLKFALADGSIVERGVGRIGIALDEGPSLPSTTVVFGDEGVFLLGAITLEDLSLAVDPANKRLVQVEGRLLTIAAGEALRGL